MSTVTVVTLPGGSLDERVPAPWRADITSPGSAMRSRPTGLQLPQSLLDELNVTTGDRNGCVHQPFLATCYIRCSYIPTPSRFSAQTKTQSEGCQKTKS